MSDSTNPIFDSEREFLERQKEEYKNALMGNVEDLKDTSQRIGKMVLIAGGVLAGAFVVTKMIRSNRDTDENPYYLSDRKAQRVKRGQPNSGYEYADSHADEYHTRYQSDDDASSNTSLAKNFAQSDLFKMISSQVSALLLVLLTRKLEEYIGTSRQEKEPEPEAGTSVVIIEDATTVVDPDTTYSEKDVR